MSKYIKQIIWFCFAIILFISIAMPVFAQTPPNTNPLVPCDGIQTKCNFAQLMAMVDRIVDFIIDLILPIGAIVISYVGFLYLSSGGSPETRKKAKGIFVKVVIGIIFILAAWLIVNTIFWALGVDSSFTLFNSN